MLVASWNPKYNKSSRKFFWDYTNLTWEYQGCSVQLLLIFQCRKALSETTMLIAVMQSWGESRHNVPGKATHFYKIQRPKENVICHDNGQRKVPHGIWTSVFPANLSTLRFFEFSSLLVANLDKGKGAYVLKVFIYFYYSIIVESNSEAMSIKEMITHQRSPWLLNKFSIKVS